MSYSKSVRAHRFHLAASIALLVLFVAITGCSKERPSAETVTPPAAPSAVPPAAPSSAPSGVFVHKDRATSGGGNDVEFYSILRFGKDGQVCSVNVSTELDDQALSRYSKSCDAHEKGREYGKYTFVNGTITFSLGETDYSGTFDKDRLILNVVYRPTQKTSTDEYRHHDVAYDNQ
ncbi:MAG TPA: hypothetical protein VFE61_21125 [Candidatus Sulfotelmatobacter sp.]|nr:hypothetical protein [Candidatus Sulfotelmatobacter sp.]